MSELSRYIRYLNEILPHELYNYKDKEQCVNTHIAYMLNRTQSMFEWSGLPDTIPARMLELYLQMNGNVCIAEHNGKLYAFVGGRGGEPDPYYMPTIYTVSNPALKFSKNYKIGVDCVVIPNDSLYMGLLPIFNRYGRGMVETELSLHLATINARIIDLISAPDDRTRKSAEKFLQDIENGENGVIAHNEFLDGLKVQPYATAGNRTITDLIELEQYYKASEFNEIGLNANYNMKRESINAGESQLNNDSLLPLVDDMLNMRKHGAEEFNEMFGERFGLDVSVKLKSSWEDNEIEIELEQDEISQGDNPTATEDGENEERKEEEENENIK